ncbi:peptidoglycan DD-metalloendopeptidase family protein [Jiella sp. KSK16Y-1]|uniref:Peptidoglycan DD-metalloendopeptidase family protein n=1 Tax=Jiella mangrovi TaxID=2821407 RepID=A0ABS4BML7_9HYPH|nr:peptidoglycan DD-metalloendopeptidase family protein [Jiella mangrovi]
MVLLAVLMAAGSPAATPLEAEIDETTVAAIPAADPSTPGAENPDSSSANAIEARRKKTAAELAALASRIKLSTATIRSLDDEIAAIAADRDKLQAALKKASDAQRKISADLDATEGRLAALAGKEDTIRASLIARRDVLAEVLAALERMGSKPPPALLVRPRDALGAVRSAILLGAVVPTMRKETETLVADLDRLASVKASIVAEKDRYAGQIKQHREEQERLSRLFEEKRRIEADSREKREAETARAAELARKADDLKDLISSLQAEADAARAREVAAREAEERRIAEAEAREAKANRDAAAAGEKLALARSRESAQKAARVVASTDGPAEANTSAVGEPPAGAPETEMASRDAGSTSAREPAASSGTGQAVVDDAAGGGSETADRETEVAALEPGAGEKAPYDIAALRNNTALLEPSAAFSTLKARLSKPVFGRQIIGFGQTDDIGRPSTGVSFASRAGDVVIAPADGRVLYAGPFRSYGELLILDVGDGYHVVLAGMDRIDVTSGQFVSSGEPVALMGARRLASVQVAEFGAAEPALYVEFRKDGKPVDPTPWWTKEPSGRTRNDS